MIVPSTLLIRIMLRFPVPSLTRTTVLAAQDHTAVSIIVVTTLVALSILAIRIRMTGIRSWLFMLRILCVGRNRSGGNTDYSCLLRMLLSSITP